MTTDASLFGQGMAFPPRLDGDGRFSWSVGASSIRESIRLILMTEPGERVMLPNFGAGLRTFLLEPNVPATHRLIEERVRVALRRWEPRIAVGAISVDPHHDDRSIATVSITYTLVATQATGTVDLSVAVANDGAGALL